MTDVQDPKLTGAAKQAIEEYEAGEVHLTPLYPLILIRLLPKSSFMESPDGSLALLVPEDKRNQVIREAIVLQTYKPKRVPFRNQPTSQVVIDELLGYLRTIKGDITTDRRWEAYDKLKARVSDGFAHGSYIDVSSQLQVGDHILFPYWSGLPIPGLPEDKYRCIPDHSIFRPVQDENTCGEPLATIDYAEENTYKTIGKMIADCLVDNGCDMYSALPNGFAIAKQIHERYHVIQRHHVNVLQTTNTRPD